MYDSTSAGTESTSAAGLQAAAAVSVALIRPMGRHEAVCEEFRAQYYRQNLRSEVCDSRETVPATLAIFRLAEGDPRRSILWGANFVGTPTPSGPW